MSFSHLSWYCEVCIKQMRKETKFLGRYIFIKYAVMQQRHEYF
jgi:hypothetical protein